VIRNDASSQVCAPRACLSRRKTLSGLERAWNLPVDSPERERIFNVPYAVLGLAVAMCAVYAIFALVLSEDQQGEALLVFSFIPARYDFSVLDVEPWWIGWGPAVWTFVTYAFLHGGIGHLFFNLIWLLAFGTPVARRFGSVRFLLFFAMTAVAGALVHLVLHLGDNSPVIGASAAISGSMAAAIRFAFQRGGPLGRGDLHGYRVEAVPLSRILQDARLLVFLLVWFGLNILFGLGTIALPGLDENVAWEAHIGGFLAGLFGFSAFDRAHTTISEEAAAPQTETVGESDVV
jgi:membrane associated rhomboid family serine protease